jgi:short-subunit dehydrogenase
MDIKDKVVIVTGASAGIGLAAAKLFAQKGGKLVLAARSKEKLDKLAAELPDAIAIPTDMTKPDEIKRLVAQTYKHYGRIDVLVNNAGQGYDSPVEKIEIEKFQHIFELTVLGPVIAMEQVIPIMRQQGGGVIVNISSGTAKMELEDMSPYASMKTALAKISLTARKELEKDKIVVSVIFPYITSTDFEKNTLRSGGLAYATDDGIAEGRATPDTPEKVAFAIIDTVQSGISEKSLIPRRS